MLTYLRATLLASSVAALAACSAPVAPVEGGGVRGTFAGELTVVVVDEGGEPIAGASVLSGEGGAAEMLGATSEDGTLRVAGAADVITATAADRAAVSVAGAGAALVTIVLPMRERGPAPIVQATVPGWADLPLEGADYLRARAGALVPTAIDAAGVRQPSDAITECTRTEAGGECSLRFAVAPSTTRVFVAIVRGTDPGTPEDESDDVLEPIALGLSDAIVEGAGVSLALVDRASLVAVEVSAESAPAGLSSVVGVPGASTPDGVIVWPFHGAGLIPAIADDASAHWAIAEARSADARSRTIARGQRFGDGDTIAIDAWREPPGALDVANDAMHVDGIREGELGRASIVGSEGALAWTAYILDARTSIAPPTAVTLPTSGTLEVETTVHAAESTDGELSFARVEESWTERSSRTLAFDHCPFAACR